MKRILASLTLAVAVAGCGGDLLYSSGTTGTSGGGGETSGGSGGGSSSGGSGGGQTSGGSSGGNNSLGGVWNGTLSNSAGGSTDALAGLIDENGNGFLVDQAFSTVYRIAADTSGSQVSGTFRAYAVAGTSPGSTTAPASGTITGTAIERNSINGGFYTGVQTQFTIGYQAAAYEIQSAFTSVAGTYEYSVGTSGVTDTVNLSFDTQGVISGSDTGGCSFSGGLRIPDAAYNAYDVSLTQTCSGEAPANFTGLFYFVPGSGFSPASLMLEYDDGISFAVVAQPQLVAQ